MNRKNIKGDRLLKFTGIVLGISGVISLCVLSLLTQSPKDMGKTYRGEQIPALMQAEIIRILNDPNMPPRAKQVALYTLMIHKVPVNKYGRLGEMPVQGSGIPDRPAPKY